MKTRPPGSLILPPPATPETILFFLFWPNRTNISWEFGENPIRWRHVTSRDVVFLYIPILWPGRVKNALWGNISIPNTTLIHTFVNSRVSSADSDELQPQCSYKIVLIKKNKSTPVTGMVFHQRKFHRNAFRPGFFLRNGYFSHRNAFRPIQWSGRKRFLTQSEGSLRALNPTRKGTKLQMKRGKHPAFRVIF